MIAPSMELAARTRLGRYEVVAPLAAGAMGEVYRARDTQLDRSVAIKVLAADVRHLDDELLAPAIPLIPDSTI